MTTFLLPTPLPFSLCLFDLFFFYLLEEALRLLLFPLLLGPFIFDEDKFLVEVLLVDFFEGPRDLLLLFLADAVDIRLRRLFDRFGRFFFRGFGLFRCFFGFFRLPAYRPARSFRSGAATAASCLRFSVFTRPMTGSSACLAGSSAILFAVASFCASATSRTGS